MFKKLNKRGVSMTEYAVLLAFIAAIAVAFTADNGLSSSIKHTIRGIEDHIAKAGGGITVTEQKQNKWLEYFSQYIKNQGNETVLKQLKQNSNFSYGQFNNNKGLLDSAAAELNSSSLSAQIMNYIYQQDPNLKEENISWVFSGYRGKDGEQRYQLCIYNPNHPDNGNMNLSSQKPGTSITTDIYHFDSNGTHINTQNKINKEVYSRSDKGNTYNTIRDEGFTG